MTDNDLKVLEIRLFAGIREAIGMDSIRIAVDKLAPIQTANALKEAIILLYPELRSLVLASRIAIGHSFVSDGDRLEEALETGKTIALIPPVSGG